MIFGKYTAIMQGCCACLAQFKERIVIYGAQAKFKLADSAACHG